MTPAERNRKRQERFLDLLIQRASVADAAEALRERQDKRRLRERDRLLFEEIVRGQFDD